MFVSAAGVKGYKRWCVSLHANPIRKVVLVGDAIPSDCMSHMTQGVTGSTSCLCHNDQRSSLLASYEGEAASL